MTPRPQVTNGTAQAQVEQFHLDGVTFRQLAQYLATKPYQEVAGLMQAMGMLKKCTHGPPDEPVEERA